MKLMREFLYFLKVFLKKGVRWQVSRLYNPNEKFVYVVVRKVASSSIRKVLFEKYLGEEILNEDVEKGYLHPRLSILEENPQGYFSFAVVRNPFDRLVSVHKFFKNTNYFDKYFWGMLIRQKEKENFDAFVKRVVKIPYFLSDGHFKPQNFVLYDKNGKCYANFIAKFENLNEDWKFIQQKTNLPNLSHINKTKKTDWRDFYSLETARLVYAYYKEDIKMFGYEQAYEDLITYIKNKQK